VRGEVTDINTRLLNKMNQKPKKEVDTKEVVSEEATNDKTECQQADVIKESEVA
jgi:hypothetical protein